MEDDRGFLEKIGDQHPLVSVILITLLSIAGVVALTLATIQGIGAIEAVAQASIAAFGGP